MIYGTIKKLQKKNAHIFYQWLLTSIAWGAEPSFFLLSILGDF